MFGKVDEIKSVYDRLEMSYDLLFEVIERTQNFREGYFALRMLNEHTKTINQGTFAVEAESMEEAIGAFLQHMENMIATVNTQIERIDA